MERVIETMRGLVDRLNEASQAYYFSDEPIMSDKEWDALYDQLSALESEHAYVLPDSPTHRVGSKPMSAFEEHTHVSRLWSMDKVQSLQELEEWIRRTETSPVPAFRL